MNYSIPPELIDHILQLSISTLNNPNKRSNLLKFSLVSKTFSILSQRILFKDIILNSNNIELFLNSLELRRNNNNNNEGIIDKVIKIKFNFLHGVEGKFFIMKVLKLCQTTIKDLTFSLVEGLTLNDLMIVEKIRSLSLSNCTISSSPSSTPFYLPTLQNISLNYVSLPLHLLTLTSLPNLKAIAIDEPLNFLTIDSPILFLNRFSQNLIGLALGDPSNFYSDRISSTPVHGNGNGDGNGERGGRVEIEKEEIKWNQMKELKVLSFDACAEWILFPLLPSTIQIIEREGREEGGGEEGKGLAIRNFLDKLEEGGTKLKVLHYPFLRCIRFNPLMDFTSSSSTSTSTTTTTTTTTTTSNENENELKNKMKTPKCLIELEILTYSLPKIIYSWTKILSLEKFSIEERNKIKLEGELMVKKRSKGSKKKELIVEWEGEGMKKEFRFDKRFFDRFWMMMDDFNRTYRAVEVW